MAPPDLESQVFAVEQPPPPADTPPVPMARRIDIIHKIIDYAVCLADVISVILGIYITYYLRISNDPYEEYTVNPSALTIVRTIIAKSVFSMVFVAPLFCIGPGKRKETVAALIAVMLLSVILACMGAYFIHESDKFYGYDAGGAHDLDLFKVAGTFQIITGVVEVIAYWVAFKKTTPLH